MLPDCLLDELIVELDGVAHSGKFHDRKIAIK